VCIVCVYFFFQAEDGIRDFHVTGVQTCALPILGVVTGTSATVSTDSARSHPAVSIAVQANDVPVGRTRRRVVAVTGPSGPSAVRSEERRVGKEWRDRWTAYHQKRKGAEEYNRRT